MNMSDFSWNTYDADAALADNPPMDFEPIPAGWYPTVITSGEWKDVRNNGRMLVLAAEVVDGQHKGRKCWNNFNLVNANPKAVSIAKGTLGALCVAAGITHPRSESELFGRPVLAHWTVVPAGDYPAKNEIKDYKPLNARPAAAPAQTTAAPDSGKKPWEK